MRPLLETEQRCPVALLLIDVINGFDFEHSEGIVAAAERVAPNIRALAERARAAEIPVIYVNDNFGRWRSDFRMTIEACRARDMPGRDVSRQLEPSSEDYFVLKPRHSGFYSTVLDLLLEQLGVERLILVGFAANICVLFTAHDARMRGYGVIVPSDCVASNDEALTRATLEHVALVLDADTGPSSDLDLTELRRSEKKPKNQEHSP
jgi:nicotinamidase-related amidase